MATPLVQPGHQPPTSDALPEPSAVPPLEPPAAEAAEAGDKKPGLFRLLLRDKFATAAAAVLVLVGLTAVFGPALMGDLATKQNLLFANKAPIGHGHVYKSGAVDGWAALAPPPGWTVGDTIRLRALLDS